MATERIDNFPQRRTTFRHADSVEASGTRKMIPAYLLDKAKAGEPYKVIKGRDDGRK